MALSWSIPSIRPGAGAFCFSNVWMWPKVDPSRPARNESAYRGTPGAGEAAVDVVGIPAYDPLRKSSGCAPHLPSRRGVHLVNSTTGQALNIPEKQQ